MQRAPAFGLGSLLVLGAVYAVISAIVKSSFDRSGEVPSWEGLFQWSSSATGGWILLAFVLAATGSVLIQEARRRPKTIVLTHFLFGASGRAGRMDYWLALLFWIIIALLVMGVIGLIHYLFPFYRYEWDARTTNPITIRQNFAIYSDHIEQWWGPFGLTGLISEREKRFLSVLAIVGLISVVMVSIRRMHDRRRSVWWLLPMYGLAIPWAIVSVWWLLPMYGFAITWVVVELGFLPGSEGANSHALAESKEDWN